MLSGEIALKINIIIINHSFKTSDGPMDLTITTTIFKKCGVNISLGRQECYILKTNLELQYLI